MGGDSGSSVGRLIGRPLTRLATHRIDAFKNRQEARERIEAELKGGKNIGKLEAAIDAGDWDGLKTYSREYDAFLRQGKWSVGIGKWRGCWRPCDDANTHTAAGLCCRPH